MESKRGSIGTFISTHTVANKKRDPISGEKKSTVLFLNLNF